MAEQFKDQGGVATMDPSRLTRWLTSRLMTRISGATAVAARHRKVEQARVKAAAPHRVHYFHQVDEGYSYLAAQMLERLADRYEIELHCHMVRGQEGKNAPEPELLTQLARADFNQSPARSTVSGPLSSVCDAHMCRLAPHPQTLQALPVCIGKRHPGFLRTSL